LVRWQEMLHFSKSTSDLSSQVCTACNGSAGVRLEGTESLHFVDEKSKGQCSLLRKPVAAKIPGRLSPVAWPTVYFQQDGSPAHATKVTQQWLAAHCPDFIDKDSWSLLTK